MFKLKLIPLVTSKDYKKKFILKAFWNKTEIEVDYQKKLCRVSSCICTCHYWSNITVGGRVITYQLSTNQSNVNSFHSLIKLAVFDIKQHMDSEEGGGIIIVSVIP